MSNARLNQVSTAVLGTFDRKTLGGVFIGVAIMMTAIATAQTTPNGGNGWFAGLFSTGGSGSGNTSSILLSQQESVMAAQITQETQDCIDQKPGTIGASIQTAMNVHSQMAAAGPAVDTLFDVNGDCFSSISQIFDLSFAIPSLASILAAAQDAVLKYAQKKVCTAVKQVTGMVTSPINQAIASINQIQGFTDINGMANSAVGGAMSGIDPQLGSQYNNAAGTNYTTNVNPFGSNQTTFSTTGGSSTQLNNNAAQINALTQQIANQQIKINQDQMNLQTAQNNYNTCSSNMNSGNTGVIDCNAAYAALQSAQQTLLNDQNALINLQLQLSQVVTQSNNVAVPVVAAARQVPVVASSPGGSWFSGLFN